MPRAKRPKPNPFTRFIKNRQRINPVLTLVVVAVVTVVGIQVYRVTHAATNLSGLAWKSGTYTGGDLASNTAWGNWRGRQLDVINTFTTRDQGWGEIQQPSWTLDTMTGFKGQLIISQPMWPQGQGNSTQCAQGAYDTYWKTFGSWLVQKSRANSIVRMGWEGNGDFMYWSATSADLSNGNWKNCWRKVAQAIKSTDPQVVMDWTVNSHGSDTIDNRQSYDPYASNSPVYPGDDVVDVVGIDSYDMYPPSPTSAAFDAQCNGNTGLCKTIAFAKAHGKKFSVGEWGSVTCGGNPGGDNTVYIQKMFDTFKANQAILAYEAYFDYTDEVCSGYYPTNQAPKASALYKQLWGVNSPAAETPATTPTPTIIPTQTPTSTNTPTPIPTKTPTPTPVPTNTPVPTPTPTPIPTPTPSTQHGLKATYFSTKTLSGSYKTRTDANVNFNWGGGSPMSGIPADLFSARWTGNVKAPSTGWYGFYLRGDDGMRLTVNGQRIIDKWYNQSATTTHVGWIYLNAGQTYPIKLEYYENYGSASVKLSWEGPDFATRILENGALTP
jgi:hypothetical protein